MMRYLDQKSLPPGAVQKWSEAEKPDAAAYEGRHCYVVESKTLYWSNGKEWKVDAAG